MSKKCLVVDDVSVSRFANRIVLEQLSFEVVEADSVETCLAEVVKSSFGVIILDWHLRRENSLSIIKKIRATAGNSNAIIIVCSGVEEVSAADVARQAGASSFVVKPTTKEKLEAELRKHSLI